VTAILFAKQLELLKEIVPNAKHFAVLSNPANVAFQTQRIKEITAAAHTLGVELQLLEARTPNDFEAVFAAIDREKTRALLILGDPVFSINVKELATLSVKSRIRESAVCRRRGPHSLRAQQLRNKQTYRGVRGQNP
jgi:putative ABC transport system substrate-binding protein